MSFTSFAGSFRRPGALLVLGCDGLIFQIVRDDPISGSVLIQANQSPSLKFSSPALGVDLLERLDPLADDTQRGIGPAGDRVVCHVHVAKSVSEDEHVLKHVPGLPAPSNGRIENLREDFGEHAQSGLRVFENSSQCRATVSTRLGADKESSSSV